METKPIPREELECAHRKLCRHIGSAIIRCMAETDTSVELMAVRLNDTAEGVWNRIHAFINGTAKSLDWVSDLAFSMGAKIEFSISLRGEHAPEEKAEHE